MLPIFGRFWPKTLPRVHIPSNWGGRYFRPAYDRGKTLHFPGSFHATKAWLQPCGVIQTYFNPLHVTWESRQVCSEVFPLPCIRIFFSLVIDQQAQMGYSNDSVDILF